MLDRLPSVLPTEKFQKPLMALLERILGRVETASVVPTRVQGVIKRLQINMRTSQMRDLAWVQDEHYNGFNTLFGLPEEERQYLFMELLNHPHEALLLLHEVLQVEVNEYSDIQSLKDDAGKFLGWMKAYSKEHPEIQQSALWRDVLSRVELVGENYKEADGLADPYDLFLPIEEARSVSRVNAYSHQPQIEKALEPLLSNSFSQEIKSIILGYALLLDDFQLAQFRNQLRKLTGNDEFILLVLTVAINNPNQINSVLALLEREEGRLLLLEIGKKLANYPRAEDAYDAAEELSGINLWNRNEFILRRLEKVFKLAQNQGIDKAFRLIDVQRFEQETVGVVTVALSVAGEHPQSFEHYAKNTEVKLFNGQGGTVEVADPEKPVFAEGTDFGIVDWEMVMAHFENSYQDYPKWKAVLKRQLLADLQNPEARFYIIYHQDVPVAIRKMVKLADGKYHAGTFYVNSPYQGIGNMLQKWTMADLPEGAILTGSVAPTNPSLEAFTENGRVITRVLTETYADLESEPLVEVETVGGDVYPTSSLTRAEVIKCGEAYDLTDYLEAVEKYLQSGRVISRVCFDAQQVYLVSEPKASGS